MLLEKIMTTMLPCRRCQRRARRRPLASGLAKAARAVLCASRAAPTIVPSHGRSSMPTAMRSAATRSSMLASTRGGFGGLSHSIIG